jgi:hypothetical protein
MTSAAERTGRDGNPRVIKSPPFPMGWFGRRIPSRWVGVVRDPPGTCGARPDASTSARLGLSPLPRWLRPRCAISSTFNTATHGHKLVGSTTPTMVLQPRAFSASPAVGRLFFALSKHLLPSSRQPQLCRTASAPDCASTGAQSSPQGDRYPLAQHTRAALPIVLNENNRRALHSRAAVRKGMVAPQEMEGAPGSTPGAPPARDCNDARCWV